MSTAALSLRGGFRGRTLERLARHHRAALLARVHSLRHEGPAELAEVTDEVDRAADRLSQGVGAALVEATSRTVQGIEIALQRLKTGTYGRCADCGREIPSARLRALPFAERCRSCQEAWDEEGVQGREPAELPCL